MFERVFLDELEGQGIRTGSYNLPDWEESASGLRQCLESLFRVSPPTAIFVGDRDLCLGMMNYLMSQRGLAHRQIALICADYDPIFDWCDPPIAHFRWDELAVVRKAVRWADNIARGKDDLHQKLIPSKFIGGDRITAIKA